MSIEERRGASVELTALQRTAQEAVRSNPEIADMARRLAQFGLGIAMPHMHTPQVDFVDLPDDMAQVEEAGIVRFIKKSEAERAGMVPVGWRWTPDGLGLSAACSPFMYCNPNVQGHAHVTGHTNS